jgi:hypothetical protein
VGRAIGQRWTDESKTVLASCREIADRKCISWGWSYSSFDMAEGQRETCSHCERSDETLSRMRGVPLQNLIHRGLEVRLEPENKEGSLEALRR